MELGVAAVAVAIVVAIDWGGAVLAAGGGAVGACELTGPALGAHAAIDAASSTSTQTLASTVVFPRFVPAWLAIMLEVDDWTYHQELSFLDAVDAQLVHRHPQA
jgi:hypothetical protein